MRLLLELLLNRELGVRIVWLELEIFDAHCYCALVLLRSRKSRADRIGESSIKRLFHFGLLTLSVLNTFIRL